MITKVKEVVLSFYHFSIKSYILIKLARKKLDKHIKTLANSM
jgi:hypothetical protein